MKYVHEMVTRTNLAVCQLLRWLGVIVLLLTVLLACVLAVLHFARVEPHRIDRCDITSEGPEGFTRAYYEWMEEENVDVG